MYPTMVPKDLLQETVKYNRKVNLTRKVLKSMKHPLPTLPLTLRGSIQTRESVRVPVQSGRVSRQPAASSKVNNKP